MVQWLVFWPILSQQHVTITAYQSACKGAHHVRWGTCSVYKPVYHAYKCTGRQVTEVVGWPIPSQLSCCTKACLFAHAPQSLQLSTAMQHMRPRIHWLVSPCRKCDLPAMALMQACCGLNLMQIRISSHLLII